MLQLAHLVVFLTSLEALQSLLRAVVAQRASRISIRKKFGTGHQNCATTATALDILAQRSWCSFHLSNMSVQRAVEEAIESLPPANQARAITAAAHPSQQQQVLAMFGPQQQGGAMIYAPTLQVPPMMGMVGSSQETVSLGGAASLGGADGATILSTHPFYFVLLIHDLLYQICRRSCKVLFECKTIRRACSKALLATPPRQPPMQPPMRSASPN